MKLRHLAGAGLLFFGLSSTANAALISMIAELDGPQTGSVIPATGQPSPGTGTASMLYNTDDNRLYWTIGFNGLVGTFTRAHFHGPAEVGSNAGIQVFICDSTVAGQTPCPAVTSGVIQGASAAPLTATQEQQLLSDLWYINLHTTAIPAGEIRGQVYRAVPSPIPLPAAAWLLAPALAGAAAFVRRRKPAT
jgi:hypothetical protein